MNLNKASVAVALAAFLAAGGIAGQALAAPHDGTTVTGDSRGRIRTAFTRRSRRKRKRSTMPS